MNSELLKLPSEILLLLPEYLDPASLDMLSQSCRTLRQLFDDNLSWRAVSRNARIGRPDRSRSRSRSRSVRRDSVRDTFQSIGRRAASEERSRGRRGPINWKSEPSSEEDEIVEEVDAEMAHMQVEHPEEAEDRIRPLSEFRIISHVNEFNIVQGIQVDPCDRILTQDRVAEVVRVAK